MKTWKPTKNQATQDVTLALARLGKGVTIFELITDPPGGFKELCLTASETRRALGWLYGRGRAKVVEVRDGEEVWALTSSKDRVAK